VYPSNIERRMLELDEVIEVAVVGLEDPDLGQRIRAVVIPADPRSIPGLTPRIRSALVDVLATYEVPREIVYVSALPRNAAGKVLTRQLVGDPAAIADRLD
jgi:fatty-acyl-CoA synthase